MRKLTYFVAVSIDGFIGDPHGDANMFMPFVDEEFLTFLKEEYPETISVEGRRLLQLEDLEHRRFDTVIQGRGSYDLALAAEIPSPYAHLREYVASRTITTSPDPNVTIVSHDVVGAVRELKQETSDFDIWLCGGAKLAGELIEEVDELIIKTYPVILGTGMPMSTAPFAVSEFALDSARTFTNGVVVRTYHRKA